MTYCQERRRLRRVPTMGLFAVPPAEEGAERPKTFNGRL
ncbi:hypothetical protein RIB2604_01200420 [Aspergillus luchuensis]|uniref:Uncharacterized protein n=1 Tax=Aspergillus kawachii TaxID=1069201 RepID=A0A146F8C5_ASPKA|nr:hypothetical protein RIB2604_01200420 [Aspergillus luchuensis]